MYEKILFQLVEKKENQDEKEIIKPYLCLININKVNFNYYLKSNNNYSLKTYLNLWIKNIIIFIKLNNYNYNSRNSIFYLKNYKNYYIYLIKSKLYILF